MKKVLPSLSFFEILLFVIVIIFAIRPVENYDFWFHAKYGEFIFKTHTLPFQDYFSHTAYMQPAIPYEWLFQVVLFVIFSFLGTFGVQALVVICIVVYLLFFRQILIEFFHLGELTRVFLCTILYVTGYDFWVERPQSVAFALFMVVLYLLLKRAFLHKGKLWIIVPLFFIWTNVHASVILGLYLCAAFAIVDFVLFIKTKNRKYLAAAKDLALYGVVAFVVTLVPPLGIKTYQLLYLFFQNREFITTHINEWIPLYHLGVRYHIYIVIITVSVCSYLFVLYKKRKKPEYWLFLPFLPLGLFVMSGIRQTAFSMPALLLLCVSVFPLFAMKLGKSIKIAGLWGVIVLATLAMYFLRQVTTGLVRNYPEQAIPFIKQHLKGNMFNELQMGGYLMYHLGPTYKTFIDGRTDMFLPVVFPEYVKLDYFQYKNDAIFLSYFDYLVHKYTVSWVLVTTTQYSMSSKLSRLLVQHPSWRLVFFDDTSLIFIRDNGVNTKTLQNYGFTAITPFGEQLYKAGKRTQAKEEYSRMYNMVHSKVAAQALGIISLEEND